MVEQEYSFPTVTGCVSDGRAGCGGVERPMSLEITYGKFQVQSIDTHTS